MGKTVNSAFASLDGGHQPHGRRHSASPTTNPVPSPSRSGFGTPGGMPFAGVLGMRLSLPDVKAPGWGVVMLSYRSGWILSPPASLICEREGHG